MKLTEKQILSITVGYNRVEKTEKGLAFLRFSEKSEKAYLESLPQYFTEPFFDGYFYRNCRTTSGVAFDFITDSSFLRVTLGDYERPNDAAEECFGLYIDGKYRTSRLAGKDLTFKLPGKSGTRVTFYFPLYSFPLIAGVELSDGAAFSPISAKGLLICYGDSITHGGGATHPGQTWAAILSRKLGYTLLDQGNSGYVYDAKVIMAPEDSRVQPALILAAYGTNDRSRKTTEQLEAEADAFWARMTELYPAQPKAMILPPWSIYDDMPEHAPRHAAAREALERVGAKYGLPIFDACRYIPHSADFFYDKAVHPNNAGYRLYGNGLAHDMLACEALFSQK